MQSLIKLLCNKYLNGTKNLTIYELFDLTCNKLNSIELNEIITTVYKCDEENIDSLFKLIIKNDVIIKSLYFLEDVVNKDNVKKWVSIVTELDYHGLLDFGIDTIDHIYGDNLSLYRLVDINQLLFNNITYNDICAMLIYTCNISKKYFNILSENIDTVLEIKKNNTDIIKYVDSYVYSILILNLLSIFQ
jgi:hypothetical protein